MAQTVDPLAGSFYVESLTNEIERRADEYLATIAGFDRNGKYGMLRAIERGYVQREIQNAAYGYQTAVDAKEAIVVGVNEFASEHEVAVPIQRIDEALEGRQVERVRALRARRDAGVHAAALRRCGGCGAGWGKFDAADTGCGGELCDSGGDCECDADGVWGVSGDGNGLTALLRRPKQFFGVLRLVRRGR